MVMYAGRVLSSTPLGEASKYDTDNQAITFIRFQHPCELVENLEVMPGASCNPECFFIIKSGFEQHDACVMVSTCTSFCIMINLEWRANMAQSTDSIE